MYRRDRLAEVVIRVGGGAVLLTVLGICVYLAAVVLPLFRGGEVQTPVEFQATTEAQVRGIQIDEYNQAVLVLSSDGVLTGLHVPSGEVLGRVAITAEGFETTAISRWGREGRLALGSSDGSIQTGQIRFRSRLRDVASGEESIEIGTSRPGAAPGPSGFRPVYERINVNQIRETAPDVVLAAPASIDEGEGAIVAIDIYADERRQNVVTLRERGPATYATVRMRRPLGGGPARASLTSYPFEIEDRDAQPDWVLVSGDGAHVYCIWRDGTCQRYSARDPRSTPIALAETVTLSGSGVTAATKLIGSQTILVGDPDGQIGAWFPAPAPTSGTPDTMALVRAHTVSGPGGEVVSINTSWRDRSIIATDVDGRALITHVASEKRIVLLGPSADSPALAGAVAPKNDALAVLHADGTLAHASYDPGFPEITVATLFAPMHYEGQAAPIFSYQSSAGDDAAEPKLSLTPLIFGTLKATLVAMLFACPLAVLAAIYTSEFLSPGVRRVVKPSIELMASLPSVVLGFIAAMVVAPIVRDILPGIMTAMVAVPMTIVCAAGLWTLIPNEVRSKVGRRMQFVMVGGALVLGFALSLLLGPPLEKTLFRPTEGDLLVMGGSFEPVPEAQVPAWVGVREVMSPDEERGLRREGMYFRFGEVVRPVEPSADERDAIMTTLADQGLDQPSIKRWLNGEIGGAWPGWVVAMVPVGAIVGLAATSRVSSRLRRGATDATSGRIEAAIAIGQPLVMLGLTCLVAATLAFALNSAGLDARDSIFGRFTPRNSLVVGVIMGFAIIPIIYSISEDALASVPNSLRAASLGSGASPWQTAVRVVLPVAASGIFSASMIGLGRAVGETMIVLMATGNTPTMDLNIFEGFRTLSANIAVELPEAPKGEGLYRILFLCGLVLFVMTFVINTTAEVVRQHYRKKNALL